MTNSTNYGLVGQLLFSLNDHITAEVPLLIRTQQGATPLPTYQHTDKVLYIFGPEDGTIQQEVLDRADSVVFIPTIESLNLAAAVNVMLYDRLAKMPASDCYKALIRESRDTNNHTKVKNR
jgi:tRNA(Leu) C34 or U34 (ribose-2'-O)-methylase TrmL